MTREQEEILKLVTKVHKLEADMRRLGRKAGVYNLHCLRVLVEGEET